jgi:hypothetical protein
LRDVKSGTFFKTKDLWMSSPKHALDFEERDRAIRVALELGLKNVELVIIKEDGTFVLAARLSQSD